MFIRNLNDTELKERVNRHCGKRIANGTEPCESCQKKLYAAKVIERQKDIAWKMHKDWIRQERRR